MKKGMIPDYYFYESKSLKGKLIIIKEALEEHCECCNLYNIDSDICICEMCECINAKNKLEKIINGIEEEE